MDAKIADRLIDLLGYRGTQDERTVRLAAASLGDGLDDMLRLIFAATIGGPIELTLKRADAVLTLPRCMAIDHARETCVQRDLAAAAVRLRVPHDDTLLGALRMAVMAPDWRLDHVSFDILSRNAAIFSAPVFFDGPSMDLFFGDFRVDLVNVTVTLSGSLFYAMCGCPISYGTSSAFVMPPHKGLQ